MMREVMCDVMDHAGCGLSMGQNCAAFCERSE